MLQFSENDIQRIRARSLAQPEIIEGLKSEIAPMVENLKIPTTGIATWAGFYACPDCSIRFTFRYDEPHKHLCPICKKEHTGEVYDRSWWRTVNGMTAESCYKAAVIYLCAGDKTYFDHAKKVLMEYAKYYPGYEVHGGIPYNNPGKANAQTLCDSMWVRALCCGYDIIREELSAEERAFIDKNLLTEAGEFLRENRANQIHNHECIADASIAVIGFLLNREDLVQFAVYEKYGLRYQLAHGVLKDGLWFEGTTSYHFFAMEQFMDYEHFARYTPHTFTKDERFFDILGFPVNLVKPDGNVPLLNDISGGKSLFLNKENIYELAYALHPSDDLRYILTRAYEGRERKNIHSLLFGAEELPLLPTWPDKDYHNADGSGLSTFYGKDGRFLLVKHSPFGGEHDHYDRLGIQYMAYGKDILPDMGTCPYGAPLHYAYYKNTLAHNTVSLNTKNQPPVNCTVSAYEKGALLKAECAWDGNYQPLDSFVIKQWDDEAYKDAIFRREIRWHGDYFEDIFEVEAPNAKTIDFVSHVRGKRIENADETFVRDTWGEEKPACYLTNVKKAPAKKEVFDLGDGVKFNLFALEGDSEKFVMQGYDNPSDTTMPYVIRRVTGQKAKFVTVYEAFKDESKYKG